jgi:hypothetical protein
MIKHINQIMFLMGFLIPCSAFAGNFSAELDRTEVRPGEPLILTLSIEGSIEGDLQSPSVPGVQFNLVGNYTSSSYINGQQISEKRFQFQVVAVQPGQYTIPAIHLTIDGKKESTLPLKFDVDPNAQGSQNLGQGQNPSRQPFGRRNRRQAKPANPPKDGGIVIKKTCDKTAPYLGEQIVCTTEIYHLNNLVGGNMVDVNATDMRRFKIEGEEKYAKMLNGRRYNVIKVQEILVPQKEGKLVTPPFILNARVAEWTQNQSPLDDWFGGLGGGVFNFQFNSTREREIKVQSNEIPLAVKKLPDPAPTGFENLIGQFNLQANVSKRNLAAGETATITITISGRGILDSLAPIKPQLPSIGKVYDDKPVFKEQVTSGGISGSKSFKYALVPNVEGQHDLGSVEIPYFDPNTGQYKQLAANLGTLIVTPGQAEKPLVVGQQGPAPDLSKQDVKQLAEDLLGIHRDADLSRSDNLTSTTIVVLGTLGGAPMGLAFMMFGFNFFRQRSKGDVAKIRASKALSTYLDQENLARSMLLAGDYQSGFSALHVGYRKFIGDKLNLQGEALTMHATVEKLKSIGLSPEHIKTAEDLKNMVERLEYGGAVPSAESTEKLAQDISALVKEVDRLC